MKLDECTKEELVFIINRIKNNPLCNIDYYLMIALDDVQFGRNKNKKTDQRLNFHVIDNRTGEEADPCEIADSEGWADSLIYCDIEGFAILENGSLAILDECGNYVVCPSGRFTVVFDGEGSRE